MVDAPRFFSAKVVRWVDGDTVWLEVDLGFRSHITTDFRLYGIDTPERGDIRYMEAIQFVNGLAPAGSNVQLRSYKDPDKYGRWLAEVTPLGPIGSVQSVNNQLVNLGLAVPYFGGKK